MTEKILHEEIPIPRVNEFPFEKGQEWAKANYARARAHVDEKRAREIKEEFPLRTVYYVTEMTFGIWCLTGPSKGQDTSAPSGFSSRDPLRDRGMQSKSPLDMVLDLLKPYIVPAEWSQFKRQLRKYLIRAYLVIIRSHARPSTIKFENDRLKQLLNEFALKEYDLHLDIVPHPETAEYCNSPRFLEIKSKIREFFIGKPLDKSLYQRPQQADDTRQMDMHLDIQVAR